MYKTETCNRFFNRLTSYKITLNLIISSINKGIKKQIVNSLFPFRNLFVSYFSRDTFPIFPIPLPSPIPKEVPNRTRPERTLSLLLLFSPLNIYLCRQIHLSPKSISWN